MSRELEPGRERLGESRLRLVRSTIPRESPPEQIKFGARIGSAVGINGLEDVRLDFSSAQRGLYISGKPRTGKSAVMLNLILDNFRHGRATCVIDPHGELVKEVLARVPSADKATRDRVVVFDPTHIDRPIGLDLLHARDEVEKDRAIHFMLEIIERMPPGHACNPILAQGVRNLMRLILGAGGRLTDITEILVNRSFREKQLQHIHDPLLLRYWTDVWPKIENSDEGGVWTASLTSKFSPFLEDPAMRNIFGQRSRLNIDEAINARCLLLFDLGRGRLGNMNSNILGLVILHCLEMAVLRLSRAQSSSLPGSGHRAKQVGLSLYVDEAHEFDVENLRRMLTAFPKQGAALILANQSIEDLGADLRRSILDSIGSFLILRQGTKAASFLEELTQPRFDNRDLMGLGDHQGVLRLDTTGRLRARRVSLSPPSPIVNSEEEVKALRTLGSERLGRDRKEMEADLLARFDG